MDRLPTGSGPRAVLFAAGLLAPAVLWAHEPHDCPDGFPDSPVFEGHLEQQDIGWGGLTLDHLVAHGARLFSAKFNTCDGQGRPAATGTGESRVPDEPAFIRTSAPDSNACAGCHNDPRSGGSGDFVANVFVLAQALDPVTDSVEARFSNERNTLGMFGAGAIEMLAREMTRELRDEAAGLPDGWHTLRSKGIPFPVRLEAGEVAESIGVDTDLVVRPFHQAGVVVSLREFTVNAFNHHHGMQAEERFDLNPDKGFSPDFDQDGVTRELTVGDVTAATLFQAQLGVPGRRLPADPAQRRTIEEGERLFEKAGCTGCHRPELVLEDPRFSEPNPFNPPGTFSDRSSPVTFDLTRDGERPRLERGTGGTAVVRAYTDLKRHNLCDPPGHPDPIRFLCNEQLAQGRADQRLEPDGELRPGTEFFLTRKLWDVGNSAPYGHRGDLTTITEAIRVHGGEGRPSLEAFEALPEDDQAAVVAFLKSLQVLPPGSPPVVIGPPGQDADASPGGRRGLGR